MLELVISFLISSHLFLMVVLRVILDYVGCLCAALQDVRSSLTIL